VRLKGLDSAPDPRSVALDLLDLILGKRRLLDDAFDHHPALPLLAERDRAFARHLVAGTLRRLGQVEDLLARCLEREPPPRIRQALRLGAAQLLFLGTAPHAAISTSVELIKRSPLAGFAKLANAVLRRLDREGRAWVAEQDEARLNTPAWLHASWERAYGAEGARMIALAHLHEAPVDITVAADPAGWADRLQAEILPSGSLRRRAGGDIAQLPGYDEGQWWVQDAAAALPARLLGDVRGKRVADLCAAPGGKAMQLAAAGGVVTAVDRSAKRMRRFSDNLARLKLEAEIVEADAAQWRPEVPFPAILLDAPCSATGTIRRHPDVAWNKQPADIDKLAAAQGALLDAAIAALEPGGTLVYCVCSLQSEEGEAQVARLLQSGAPVRRVPVRADELGGMAELITPEGDLRSLPCHLADRGGMDAFFAARLTRLPG
jgi:16S rRNA (cytosine967-C5)-methyltransferase